MLSVVYTECRYAKCHNAECRSATVKVYKKNYDSFIERSTAISCNLLWFKINKRFNYLYDNNLRKTLYERLSTPPLS